MNQKKLQIGIIGSAGKEEYSGKRPNDEIYKIAYKLGLLVAKTGAILITGGKTGIMEQAAKGAKKEGGCVIGVVKGAKRKTANKYTDVEVVSGMEGGGEASILILSCDGIIGVGGGAGTLQELTYAYRNGKPVVLINSQLGWSRNLAGKYLDDREITKFQTASSPEKAVKMLFELIKP